MATAHDVADYFLSIAAADNDGDNDDDAGEGLTHLKLQKLLYYAQGFHLALFGKQLFPEAIEAWKHGPVVSAVWDSFKQHGSASIPASAGVNLAGLLPEQRDLLNDVWNAYGQFSAWKLRNMTHEEAPWKNAYQSNRNGLITETALKSYFQTQVVDSEESP